MNAEVLMAAAEKLVAFCRAGAPEHGLAELYHPDAVSVEATPGPDGGAETRGLDGIRGKHAWWNEAMEVHSAAVEGPFPHGDDRFAVIFGFEATERASGRRFEMREVAVYTIDPAGKITREEFFYRT